MRHYIERAGLPALLALALLAQETPRRKPSMTLQIQSNQLVDRPATALATSHASRHVAVLNLLHGGDLPMIAYAFRVEFSNAQGKKMGSVCRFAATILPESRIPWQPQETIQEEVDIPSDTQGAMLNYEATADFAAYGDGSMAGPDVCHQSIRLEGMQVAMKAMRHSLNQLLQERGAAAVIEELKK